MKKILFAICAFMICSNFIMGQNTNELEVNETFISLFGRKIELDKNGFPKQIQTFFYQDGTASQDMGNHLLAENIHFHFVRKSDGKNIKFIDGGIVFTDKSKNSVSWKAKSISDSLQVDVVGFIGLKGRLIYFVKVTALHDILLKDITMHIPFQKNAANYMSGLVQKYALRPEKVEWKWEGAEQMEETWLGNVNGGLQYILGDEKSIRMSKNPSFQKRSLPPISWYNNGRGGITIGIKGSSMLVNNFTGERQMTKGEVLYYNFTLLVTPSNTTKK
jgi:hypothetical protein